MYSNNLNIIDKRVSQPTNSSFWTSHEDIPAYTMVGIIGLSLYEGNESRIGKTAWKSIDALIVSTLFTETFKSLSRRMRPRYTDNPNFWLEKGHSFPSQHVASMTAMVTPFILEYQDDYPLIHLLWGLPAHQMLGRVKAQAHWQTDVIAGFLIGAISGKIAYNMDSSILLNVSSDGVVVGWKHKF